MRRSDREIKEPEELLDIIRRCDVCRLAFNDGETPYLVPLSFGAEVLGDALCFYFHSATEGKKLHLIAQNKRAAFELDCSHQFVFDEEACRSTMRYESVMGTGKIELVAEEEKTHALDVLVSHYHPDCVFSYPSAALSKTVVIRLTVETITGKRNLR